MMANLEPLTCQHPVLSPANLDYKEDCGYSAEYRRRSASEVYTVVHTVAGERCLIRDLLLEGRAAAVCTVVASWAMYRRVFRAEAMPGSTSAGDVRVVQDVPLRTTEFESPIKMQPAIVIIEPPPPMVLREEHGVDEAWYGAEITFEKGAILTDHPWWETVVGESILKVVKAGEDELAKGSYEVSPVQQQGFYFQMKVAPDLFDAMHHPQGEAAGAHVNSLYAAALAEGLIYLRDEFKEREDWGNFTNLRSLYAHLKQNNLMTWDEGSDDEFRPNQIVAGLAPHEIYNPLNEEALQGELF